jgi:uncharacterized membrane protein YbhN (UPF0104 family)
VRIRWVRIIAGVGSVGVAASLLVLALPAIADVSWSAIGDDLSSLSMLTLLALGALWLAGLWVYTFVLTSSLPGLRHAQAFVLNCAGSAVSNLVPFGGAVGVAVTFAMAGSWGHSRRAIAVSATVSGAWNILARLALPAIGLGALAVSGHVPDRGLTVAAVLTTVLLLALLALGVAALTLNGRTPWVARLVNRLLPAPSPVPSLSAPSSSVSQSSGGSLAARGSGWRLRLGHVLRELRRGTVDVIRRGWLSLTVGMIGYMAMQYLLFHACLAATSADVGIGVTVAAFALSRILATSSVTPGGIGVTESGTAALLIALGAPGAPVAAALVLFGFFSHVVEIPVGGLAWATWATARRWRVKAPADAPSSPGSDPE